MNDFGTGKNQVKIGLRGSDPIAGAVPESAPATDETEGLLGWGTTYFLVCDPKKPAPVWVVPPK